MDMAIYCEALLADAHINADVIVSIQLQLLLLLNIILFAYINLCNFHY